MAVKVGVSDGVKVAVKVGVFDGVKVAVNVGVSVGVNVAVKVGVLEGVKVAVFDGVSDGVSDGVKDGVSDGVRDGVNEGVLVGVELGVGVLTLCSPLSSQSATPFTRHDQLLVGTVGMRLGLVSVQPRPADMAGTLTVRTLLPLMKTSACWAGSKLPERFST